MKAFQMLALAAGVVCVLGFPNLLLAKEWRNPCLGLDEEKEEACVDRYSVYNEESPVKRSTRSTKERTEVNGCTPQSSYENVDVVIESTCTWNGVDVTITNGKLIVRNDGHLTITTSSTE